LNDPSFKPGIRFGNRNVAWDVIDTVEHSLWGNLILKSRTISGALEQPLSHSTLDKKLSQPDTLLKIPFGCADHDDQKLVISEIQNRKPSVVLNQRLSKRIAAHEIPAAHLIQPLGAIILLIVLLDVGSSTFNYLQMLENYYLARVDATAGSLTKAQSEFNAAENIRLHPFPLSWVTTKLMSQEPVAPNLFQARADALWNMGKKEEAIRAIMEAGEKAPKSFRINLKAARMLAAAGRKSEAEAQLQKAMESKKDSFLPQLYMVALKQEHPSAVRPDASRMYQTYRDQLNDALFADEPHWPPGGDLFLHDIWFSDDLDFVFSRLIGEAAKTKK
jgi:tetratricopeptide (TPR) repeat protein